MFGLPSDWFKGGVITSDVSEFRNGDFGFSFLVELEGQWQGILHVEALHECDFILPVCSWASVEFDGMEVTVEEGVLELCLDGEVEVGGHELMQDIELHLLEFSLTEPHHTGSATTILEFLVRIVQVVPFPIEFGTVVDVLEHVVLVASVGCEVENSNTNPVS